MALLKFKAFNVRHIPLSNDENSSRGVQKAQASNDVQKDLKKQLNNYKLIKSSWSTNGHCLGVAWLVSARAVFLGPIISDISSDINIY